MIERLPITVKELKVNELYYQVGTCCEPTMGLTISTWVYLGESPKGWYRFCEWNEFMHMKLLKQVPQGAGFFSSRKDDDEWLEHFVRPKDLPSLIQIELDDLLHENLGQ